MALSDEPRFVDGVWGPHFAALTPDQWLIDGGQSAFGAAIDHLLRLHPAFGELKARAGPNALTALEKDIVARAGDPSHAALIAEGLHVLPDFIGSRSPLADPAARGAVAGMDLREDAASLQELHVAGLCGLAYGVADIVRKLEQAGYDFESIVVSGGAARSALVRQIMADVCGKTVEAPETPEPVLLGSAMIGAVAAGTQTHCLGDVVDVEDRAEMRAGGRGGRGAPCAKAPGLRDPAAGRARDSRDDARGRAGPKSSFSIATACWSTAR